MSRSLGFALVCFALSSALASGSHGQEALPRPNEAEAKIESALGEPARLHFVDQPLADVVEQLAKRHKIAIQIDNKTLAQVGLGSNTPVTAHVEGVTLRSALRLMLAQRALTYAIHDEALVITTQSEAENMLTVAFYPVGDLVATDNGFRPPPAPGQVFQEDYQELIELITSCVAPTSWDEVGGPGAVHVYPRSLAITQTAEVHAEIAAMLAALRQARHKQRLAAKLLEKTAEKPQPAEGEAMEVRVYRLIPQPAIQTAVPNRGMGGGGVFAVADDAPAGDKAADGNAAQQAAVNPAALPDAAPAAGDGKQTATAVLSAPAPTKPDVAQFDRWAKEIAAILPEVIAPESWQPEGEGFVRVAAASLVIRQTDATHRKIRRFLRELLPDEPPRNMMFIAIDQPSPALAVPGPQVDWPQEAEPRPNASEAAIERALDARLDLSFTDAPLSDVVDFIKQKTKLDVQVDSRALLGLNTPVTRRVVGLSLRSALRLLLGDLDLTYVIRDEALLITSEACGENMLICKVYPAFDLVVRPSHAPQVGVAIDFSSLQEGLTSNIAPTSWDEVGGPGSIQPFTNAGAVVISQTIEIHEEIARYLRALREVGAEQ